MISYLFLDSSIDTKLFQRYRLLGKTIAVLEVSEERIRGIVIYS